MKNIVSYKEIHIKEIIMKYRSTRDNNIIKDDKVALLQGLSEDGGLFVLENLSDQKINLENLIDKSYTEIAFEVLKLFFSFDENKLKSVIEKAYSKFSTSKVTPLVELKNAHILELFHGPTSAFKDVALTLLPYLIQLALEGTEQEILILTATSGDTGKAALEGFKDVKQYVNRKDIEIELAFTNSIADFLKEKNTCINAASLLLRTVLFPLYPRLGLNNAAKIAKVLGTLP